MFAEELARRNRRASPPCDREPTEKPTLTPCSLSPGSGVEDDSAAALLFKVILGDPHPATTLRVIQNPESALNYLRGESPFEDATMPDLVVLDLHMPDMDGLSLLEQIRADPRIAHLPVVFFSSSLSAADHEQAVAPGALAFIHKPHDLAAFEQALPQNHALAG